MAKRVSKAKTSKNTSKEVPVKSGAEVVAAFNKGVELVFHAKVNRRFSKNTRDTLVAYGPWLMSALLLVILPELLVFAKEGRLVGPSGFFTVIFFNQESWILMSVVLANCLLLADGLSDVFAKKQRGWQRLYIALLINGGYVIAHLLQNPTQFAAPALSLAAIGFFLFATLDIRTYYK